MNHYYKTALIALSLIGLNCKDQPKEKGSAADGTVETVNDNKGEIIIEEAIKAHGGPLYDSANYQFVFRDKLYTFNNKNGNTYTVHSIDSVGNRIADYLKNGTFKRTVNENPVTLSLEDKTKYSNALNSVVYFATLPHKLKDNAVIKQYVGEAVVKGEDYDVVKVTFKQEGGGVDHDDIFMYWINKKSHYINYLAYSYSVNEGGVRFRSAYNPRTVDGIRFQDYINWEAPIGTSLSDLPALFEKGQLKELSRIETVDVQNMDAKDIEE
ncbi:DUF6503 family protein [Maribacter sp. MAR_2009_72]|uniref:DUF6503 family protein n=1 Tax=Maribacter sp. MAR_2009_72 TaxID=1250050 RepID=UPI00119BCACD|nr:DUF6503 family protein [Maribacter sp. MAR_2009_72]TVZ16419.1 hypothetical protein JM81_2679 [Maribacter sp. MAR_2009_72]